MPGPVPNKATDPLGLVGTLIDDRYRVVKLIGAGGMGFVYEANHERIQRAVAVKVLSSVQARRRFEREAVATARIDHPNSVHLSDFGQLPDGTLYLVMELLGGDSLGRLIDDGGPLEPTRALRICRDILAALGHAHKNGIVHRDIKPENVHLCRDVNDEEIAKVLDFGIAKLVSDATASDEGDKLTEVGMAIGTPTYMSPEQGFGSGIDGRSDLYSTTVLLFEMLTGHAPFRAKAPLETLRLHISAPIPTLASRAPEVSHPALEALVADGMAKKPAERIASASDYIERIDAVLATLEAIAPDTPTTEVPVKKAIAAPAPTPTPAPAPTPTPAPTPAPAPAPTPAPTPTPTPSALVSLTPSLELAAARSGTAPVSAVSAAEPARRASRHRALGLARRLWPLWLLLVAIVAIAVIVSEPGKGKRGAVASGAWMEPNLPAIAPTSTALAREADALLSRGDASEAIALLEKAPSIEDDASAQLVLGHAHVVRGKTGAALSAYARAIELVAGAGNDKRLLSNVFEALESRASATASSALEVLVAAAASAGNGAARARVVAAASEHRRRQIREAALDAARRLKLDGLDWLRIHVLELEQGRRCRDRLDAVGKLRELGDKGAIEPLRNAERRLGGGLLGIGRKNINHCLSDQARDAADYLESL